MTTPDRSTGPDRADGGSSVALLVDLVTNVLDPGYAAAAALRGTRSPRRRRTDRIVVAVGCVLTGFTLAIAYVSTHRAAPAEAHVHTELVSKVRAAQKAADGLDQSAQSLNSKIDSLRNQALGGSTGLRQRLQTDQLLAGASAVTGPGIYVTLADPTTAATASPTGRPGSTPLAATQLLTDRDISSVVNELWSAGAEAIAVNDVRLTPTSAIRFAGEAVLVDFEPINEPYVIRAIGNADRLDTGFAASDVASRYLTLASVRGITFSFDERSSVDLPASTVNNLIYARAASAGPTDSTATSSTVPSSRPSTPVSTGASK